MTAPDSRQCSVEGCAFPSGPCAKGFPNPIEECPSLGDPLAGGTEDDFESVPERRLVSFEDGLRLDEHRVSAILARRPSRVVAIVGSSESGKTTFITSLFEQFRNGPFAGFLFSGSETLLGLEQRCHESRLKSGRELMHSERTKRLAMGYLHLAVRAESLVGSVVDLILTDFPGEMFDAARNTASQMQDLHVISRADHVLMLLDAERLIAPATRHAMLTHSKTFLRRAIEEGMLTSRTSIHLVVSKVDLLRDNPYAEPIVNLVNKHRTEVTAMVESLGLPVTVHQIAARPTTGPDFDPVGMEGLFRSLLTTLRHSVHEGLPSRKEFPFAAMPTVAEFAWVYRRTRR